MQSTRLSLGSPLPMVPLRGTIIPGLCHHHHPPNDNVGTDEAGNRPSGRHGKIPPPWLQYPSGSEHDAVDPSYFSGPVHAFLETNETSQAPDCDDGGLSTDSEEESTLIHGVEIVRDILNSKDDQLRMCLFSDASTAAESLADLRPTGSGYRRAVMGKLRAGGYNAGLCKVRWVRSSGQTAGNYEYIDVVLAAERNIVDLDFAVEFEIARATEEYRRFMALLPKMMVGTAEEVSQVVKLVAKAAVSSLRSKGLSIPLGGRGSTCWPSGLDHTIVLPMLCRPQFVMLPLARSSVWQSDSGMPKDKPFVK